MNYDEKLALYNAAKEAYYNGEEIMTDTEFDALEAELGLENKSYVGAKHNASYTVKHPVIMGSLGKVQIKKDSEGNIDWDSYRGQVEKIILRNHKNAQIIITPKYDGCSFEAIYENGVLVNVSTRGDGQFGRDIRKHIEKKLEGNSIDTANYILRGEVLIDKNVFAEKYSEFVNPRSFVSGLLNRDYTPEIDDMLNDLSIVIYDIRVLENGTWVETDWTDYDNIKDAPEFSMIVPNLNDFDDIYSQFEDYRENVCNFALDGFVIKPTAEYRENNVTEARPKDCVAVKFVPMLEETEVVDIKWQLGKTGEYNPVIITKPVIMDGKKITKASAHNYGFLIDNNVSIGTKVILSLAGDIIPFIYKITNTDNFSKEKMNIPDETYVDGCHLIKILDEKELKELRFITSANSLNIKHIGNAVAKSIFDYVASTDADIDDFFGEEKKETPSNILLIDENDIYNALGGKNGERCLKEFRNYIKTISLAEIIRSLNYKLCGNKVSVQIEKMLTGQEYDFTSMPAIAYEWAKDENSPEMRELKSILKHLGRTIDDFKTQAIEETKNAAEQIPVILTGDPNDYSSKSEFLRCHPEYRQTGKWTEVKIVFTNSLESNTGKMKKAREKNIEIRLY